MKRRKSFDIETSLAIGIRIKEARGDVTQEHFATAIGVSRTALTNYEAGRRLPNDLVLKRISDISGIPIPSILFGRTSVPFEQYLKNVEDSAIKEAQRRPGFIPRFMVTDDEYSLISLFRLMAQEHEGREIIQKVVHYWETVLDGAKDSTDEPVIQWGEGHLERLRSSLHREWDEGFDPLQSYWVTFWEEGHERRKDKPDDRS